MIPTSGRSAGCARSGRPRADEARGATHSLADLLALDPESLADATIVAEVIGIAGDNARVSDGETTIVVLCPPAVSALGPRLGEWFEFDVVRGNDPEGPAGPPAREQIAAALEASLQSLGADEELERMVARTVAESPLDAPDATARAIRRLDGPPD